MNYIEGGWMKKILVIMATYNGEKYLEEQLNSILQQKNVCVDILVRDDGSSDSTVTILNRYRENGKLEWYTGEHLNVANGFFDLMLKAKQKESDYIAFSDQDDVWDIDKLTVAVDKLDKFDQNVPNLYYCGQNLVDEELRPIAVHELNKNRTLKTRFIMSDFAGCTGVFNRALLDAVTSYKPNYMLMHDTWILKICIALGGNVVVDSHAHMQYRQHGGNTVGLGRSIPAYMKQVKQYLTEYKIEKQLRELYSGYSEKMLPDYKRLTEIVLGYRTSIKNKMFLLNKENVNFFNKGLNLTYSIKVLFNRL